jgi:hypothetical protein
VLEALFKSMFAEIRAPIVLSNLQGDAALSYLPEESCRSASFRSMPSSASIAASPIRSPHAPQHDMQLQRLPQHGQLDLKFFLHLRRLCDAADGGTEPNCRARR